MMAKLKRILMGLAAVGLSIGATGCASSNVTKTVHGAPIVYKVGDGAAKYASVSTPRTPFSSSVPDSYIPAHPNVSYPAPAPVAAPVPQRPALPQALPQYQSQAAPQAVPQQSFDQASVDADLYKHQRVGNTYTIMGKSYTPKHDPSYDVTGVASWYGDKFHGKPTATGETYDMHDLTAAHKTLPLNSMLFVTNVENGKTLMVRLNDRGPFIGDRIIDLSKASADALGIEGLGQVRVQYAGPADPMAANRAPVTAPVEIDRPVQDYGQAPVPAPHQPAPAVPYTPPAYAPAPPAYTPAPVAPAPAPIAQAPAPAPAPFVPAAPVAPTAPSSVANQNTAPDGQVTLTIKGPIHVAKYNTQAPQVIRERLQTK